MLLIDHIAARVPGLQHAERSGKLVSTRHIIEHLAPLRPDGANVALDFIEGRLGIRSVALSTSTFDFLDRQIWSRRGRPFAGLDEIFRLLPRGAIVNESLMELVGECMDEVLPSSAAERKTIARHIHIGLAPPTDMDRRLGALRRAHGLAEHIPTEYVAMACPSLPAVLAGLERVPVTRETLCLITGDQNMLPFAQQYAPLAEDERGIINRWLYVAVFGEATGAALVRVCPPDARPESRAGWEVLSVDVGGIPGVGVEDWRGVITPEGGMDINVKNVISTYEAAMGKQVPLALGAIAAKNRPEASPEQHHAIALAHLHRYCFHESNFVLLSKMAQAHQIPRELVPGVCDRSGSPVGMSMFVTLADAMRSWHEQRAAGEPPKPAIGASVVGQAGINVASGHIALQATPALQAAEDPRSSASQTSSTRARLSAGHVRSLLDPLTRAGDMRGFLREAVRADVRWRVMGTAAHTAGSYTGEALLAHWDRLIARLHPNPYRLVIDDVIVDDARAVAVVQLHGEAPLGDQTGHYRQVYCWIMRFDEDGRVGSLDAYLDTAMADATLPDQS